MPRGDKSKYTDKQKRKAEHIAEGYRKEGVSAKTAKARAWATVNKDSGGGEKPGGSGRKVKDTTASSRAKAAGKSTHKRAAKKSAARKSTARKSTARKSATSRKTAARKRASKK